MLFLALCSRRRYWQWYVLAGFAGYDTPRPVFPSVVNARGDSTGAVLGQGDMPFVILSDAFSQTARKTVVVSQLHFFDGHRHSLSFRRGRSSWSSLFSRPQSFPSYCSMVDVPVMRACRFSGAAVEMSLALPQLQLAEKSDSFYDPSHLAVTCSVFASGVQDSGLLGDGFRYVPVFSACWFNTGFVSASVYGGFWKNFSRLRPSYFSEMLGSTADSCSCVRLRRLLRSWLDSGYMFTSGYGGLWFTLQKTAEIPQLQFFKVVDISVMVQRQVSMVLLFTRPW